MSSLDDLIGQMRGLTRRSNQQLVANQHLSAELHDMQTLIVSKESRIEELSTRYENSQIFLQHLASLSLRCDFLEKQLANLEVASLSANPISATRNLGLNEFRQWKENSLNWRTVETTYDNLRLEYEYLTGQLRDANTDETSNSLNCVGSSTSVDSPTSTSHFPTSDASIFSSIQDTTASSTEILDPPSPSLHPHKRKLLKMESFLAIPYDQQTVETPNELPNPSLKHFRISSLNGDRQNDEFEKTDSISPRLPVLDEMSEETESDEESSPIAHRRHNSLPGTPVLPASFYGDRIDALDGSKKGQPISPPTDLSWFFGGRGLKSKPYQAKATLRHCFSHSTGLNRRHDKFNLKDFTFEENERKDTIMESEKECEVSISSLGPHASHAPSLTTVKHSHMDGEVESFSVKLDEEDNESSYGEEEAEVVELEGNVEEESINVQWNKNDLVEHLEELERLDVPEQKLEPVQAKQQPSNPRPSWNPGEILRREEALRRETEDAERNFRASVAQQNSSHQQHFNPFLLPPIRKSHSHESIFDKYQEVSEKTSYIRDQDLKTQTLKWLKPSLPVVASSNEVIQRPDGKQDQPESVCSSFRRLGADTANNGDESAERPFIGGLSWIFDREKPISRPEPQLHHQLSMSLTSQKEAAIASSATKPIDIIPPSPISSSTNWWSSIIPNSALITSETGKLIDQPAARSLAENSGKALFRNLGRTAPNGAYSTMVIGRNGSRMIRHGYGSDFNDNVLSSRVSHAALREALESDMKDGMQQEFPV
ncbi:DEKNAAC104189 [Brettanomyces naardenensis]|uniref:DEKNAAC104189 n=1 Tax=Brettanomyces naardenensis TaxID=13370 RepID=A0A448YQD7_BRENA|nr:DEKNAAC104189 [Brettanomyces naardenensis]